MTENEREIYFRIIHDLEKIIPLFKETHQYLRKRRGCKGELAFRKGMVKMDKLLMSYCRRYNAYK